MVMLQQTLSERVTEQVQRWTGRRVRDLSVEVAGELIVLRGFAPSFYVKQLALHGVRESLPEAEVRNAIAVA